MSQDVEMSCRHKKVEPLSGRHFTLETFLIEWCVDCGALKVGKSLDDT